MALRTNHHGTQRRPRQLTILCIFYFNYKINNYQPTNLRTFPYRLIKTINQAKHLMLFFVIMPFTGYMYISYYVELNITTMTLTLSGTD